MKNKKLLLLVLLLLITISVVGGISVAVFTFVGEGNTNNIIETGKISFSYSDALQKGNGIYIEEAVPLKDSEGVLLSNENEYFDFSVTASTTSTDMGYEIVVRKEDGSTLDDDKVKIYLTELDGGVEKAVPLMSGVIPTYNELKNTTNSLLTGKTVYFGSVKAGEVAYGKRFRLRMWIKYPENDEFSYEDLYSKTYKVRVNVAALGSN